MLPPRPPGFVPQLTWRKKRTPQALAKLHFLSGNTNTQETSKWRGGRTKPPAQRTACELSAGTIPSAHSRSSAKAKLQESLGYMARPCRAGDRMCSVVFTSYGYTKLQKGQVRESRTPASGRTHALPVAYALMTTVPLGPPTLWSDINKVTFGKHQLGFTNATVVC